MLSDQTLTAAARGLRGAVALPQFALIFALALWGGNFVAGKALASDIAPITISFWRWALALLVLLPFSLSSLRQHRALLRAHWKLIAATGATGMAGYSLCLYQALTLTTAINSLLFISTAPLLISLANRWIFRDHGTVWQLLGTLVSSLGAVVVIARGDLDRLLSLQLNRGDLWILAGVLVWVTYSVVLRQRPSDLPTPPFFTASVAAGVLLLTPMAGWQFARGERLDLTVSTAAGLLYVALGVSALGYACWTRAVSVLGPERAGTFLHLIPVFGTLMATIFLGERLAPYHLVGAALVASGLRLASRAPNFGQHRTRPTLHASRE